MRRMSMNIDWKLVKFGLEFAVVQAALVGCWIVIWVGLVK